MRYVAQQPSCANSPGLTVAVARAKFGAALLHSARPNHAAGPRRSNGSAVLRQVVRRAIPMHCAHERPH